MAVFKTSATLSQTLAKAVMANWFVCIAVWQVWLPRFVAPSRVAVLCVAMG